jgi:hypothetical protein
VGHRSRADAEASAVSGDVVLYPWYQSLYWSIGWAALHEVERAERAALLRQHRRCCQTCRLLVDAQVTERRHALLSDLISRFYSMLDGRDAILYGNPLLTVIDAPPPSTTDLGKDLAS